MKKNYTSPMFDLQSLFETDILTASGDTVSDLSRIYKVSGAGQDNTFASGKLN